MLAVSPAGSRNEPIMTLVVITDSEISFMVYKTVSDYYVSI